jgi:hypothetical protein
MYKEKVNKKVEGQRHGDRGKIERERIRKSKYNREGRECVREKNNGEIQRWDGRRREKVQEVTRGQ